VHASVLSRHKNDANAISRIENAVDFLVSVASICSEDEKMVYSLLHCIGTQCTYPIQTDEEIEMSEYPKRIVGPRGKVNWDRLTAVLVHTCECCNIL